MTFRLLGFFLIILTSCHSANKEQVSSSAIADEAELGQIDIEVSCNAAALPAFHEGLLFLHSFQFDDAAEKFQEAQKLDKDCAMAYWGEAMSENHPLWREQEKDKALEILARLGDDTEKQREKFQTDFEKDMFDAICELYGPSTKKENDKAYMQFMEKLYKKYPDNHEVHAFYALSLLGAVEDGRSDEMCGKGAKIAQSIIDENPNHPGALHYLIHSYDDPDNASKALAAANSYAKVAPDAAHALHMPSHIYVAMGMWDEVISSNQAAVAASIERKERKDLTIKAIDFHSLKWLMYGHLQRGEYAEARKLVKQMEGYCEQEPSPKAVSHNVMMKSAFLTETNAWDDHIIEDTIDYSEVPIQIAGARSFMHGMKAYTEKDKDMILGLISDLDVQIAEAHQQALKASSSMCSGSYDRSRPTETQVKRTEVMQLQLKALVAMIDNKDHEVEELLKEALEKEASTTYMYGPPDIVKPSHEMYAEWLEKQSRQDEAISYYEKVLERAPGRYIPVKALEKLKSS